MAKPSVAGESCDVTLGVTGAQTTNYYEGSKGEFGAVLWNKPF